MSGDKPGLPASMRKNIDDSPNAQNNGQWNMDPKEPYKPEKELDNFEVPKSNTTYDVKQSNTNLGADVEKRVSDAEQIRATLDKLDLAKRDKEKIAGQGASELTTKSGIPSGFTQQ